MKNAISNIKKRKVDVYLPSIDMKNRWCQAASEAGVSVSRFVLELVERHIRQNKESTS